MFRFDTEIQLLTDELRQEKTNKERAMREKEMALADKYTMEQNLSVSCQLSNDNTSCFYVKCKLLVFAF